MHIDAAKKLVVGDRVVCPPDRGEPRRYGRITFIGTEQEVQKNIHGAEYIWVNVQYDNIGRTGVWPTNRIAKR